MKMPIVGALILLLTGCQAATSRDSPAMIAQRTGSGLQAISPLLAAQLPEGARITEGILTATDDPDSALCGWLLWRSAEGGDFAAPFAATRENETWSAVLSVDEASRAQVEAHCRIPELVPRG